MEHIRYHRCPSWYWQDLHRLCPSATLPGMEIRIRHCPDILPHKHPGILLIRPLLLLSLSLMQLWYLRPHSDMPVKVLTYNVRMCVRGSYCHDFFPILRIRNQSSVSVRIFCRIHTGISLSPGLKDIRLLSVLHLQDNHLPVSHRP